MILFSLLAPIRVIGVWLDALVFGLVDDAYNVITALTSASLFDSGAVAELRKNIYVVIGVFALFRLAVSLVNAIIDPEKLTDSSAGAHIILRNVVLMFVLLIITPMIFSELRQFQQLVVENHYIDKLLTVGNVGNVGDNPGKSMQKIAIKSLIYPDTRLYDKETDEFDDACDDDCKEAINEYNAMMASDKPVNWLTISSNMGVNVDYEDPDTGAEDTVFAYHYYFIITLVFAGYLAYIMYSFAIDIAIRNIKFVILEVLSPLFIATIIDPKSMKSGPFHEWLDMCKKVYINLFIRLAAISVMIMLVGLLENIDFNLTASNKGIEGIATIILLIGILIFVKSAPKWISGLLGAKGDDGDMGGLFKKIGSAALIGGAATKAGHALYGAGTSALRNAHEARKNQKRSMANQGGRAHNNLASNYRSNRQDGGRVSSAARAIGQSYFSKDAIKRNTSNLGKTAAAGGLGFLGGVAAGASIGVKGGDLKDINAKVKADSSSRFKSYGDGYKTLIEKGTEKIRSAHTSNVEKVFGTEKEAKFNSLAMQKFGKVAVGSNGKRDPLLNPVTTGEVNNLVKTIRTKDKHSSDPVLTKLSASNPEDIAKALVQQRIDKGELDQSRVSVTANGISVDGGAPISAMKYCESTGIITKYGAADIQATAKEIAYNRASEYASNQTRISQEQQTIATTNGQILTIQNNVKATFGDDALRDVQALDRTISERNKLERDLQKAKSDSKSKPEDIRDLEKSLADATDSIKTLGAAIDGRMGEGAANGYEAALKAREDSIAAVERLTEYNQEIKDEVERAHSGKEDDDNFIVTDPMTKEEHKFLKDPTKIELVVNLLNEAKDKERKKADKILNPKDSKDSNGN